MESAVTKITEIKDLQNAGTKIREWIVPVDLPKYAISRILAAKPP